MFSNLQAPWQISPPWVQVWVHCPESLGGTYVPPPSTLTLQHEGTFHATPPTSRGFLNPTWDIRPERVPSLPLSLTL